MMFDMMADIRNGLDGADFVLSSPHPLFFCRRVSYDISEINGTIHFTLRAINDYSRSVGLCVREFIHPEAQTTQDNEGYRTWP